MFYKHLHDPSCDLFTHGEEAPQSEEAQLQAALDAEREKVKELEGQIADIAKGLDPVEVMTKGMGMVVEVQNERDNLQAQLRQVEGEREAHAQDVDELIDRCINDVLVTHATPGGKPHDPDPQIRPLRDKIAGSQVELQALRQLVSALPVVDVQEVSVWLSPDESGWLVSKRPAFPAGLYWAKFRTQAEADSFRALLAYRATLAAKDAGKEDVSHD